MGGGDIPAVLQASLPTRRQPVTDGRRAGKSALVTPLYAERDALQQCLIILLRQGAGLCQQPRCER